MFLVYYGFPATGVCLLQRYGKEKILRGIIGLVRKVHWWLLVGTCPAEIVRAWIGGWMLLRFSLSPCGPIDFVYSPYLKKVILDVFFV